jgi:hypothetical protein
MTIVCWQNGHKCQVRQMFLNPETGPGSVRCCWSVIAVRWCPSSESRSGGVHITPISLEFMVDISILNGVKHQRSHHWGAPPCIHYPRPVINTQRKLWQMTRILAGHVYIYMIFQLQVVPFHLGSGSLRMWSRIINIKSSNIIPLSSIIKKHTTPSKYQATIVQTAASTFSGSPHASVLVGLETWMHSSIEKLLGFVVILTFVVVNPPYRGRANKGGSEKKRGQINKHSIGAQ